VGVGDKKLRGRTTNNIAYCKITHKHGWTKRTIHCPTGPIFYPVDKAIILADCLEKQFTPHDFCDHDRRRKVEARVHALLASVDDTPLKFRSCDVLKEIQFLKLGKVCDFYIPISLPRRRTVYLIHLLIHCLRLGHFRAFWKEAKIITIETR
jgi:hypothetical protein